MAKSDANTPLQGLYFAARQLVDGLYTGRHASPLRGAGIEFHDYRPYTPGDDLRAIDWKRFGRTDRYYLKRYRRETDLNLHLTIDGSGSMAFASLQSVAGRSEGPTKFAIAQQLAAALITLAVRQGDRAGLSICDRSLRCLHPMTGSPKDVQAMIADLEHAKPTPGEADLASSLQQLSQTLGRSKATVAIVGDLLDPPEPLLDAIDRLRFVGHEVVVFQVLTPDELSLPTASRGLRLRDLEAGPSVKTQPRAVAERYNTLMREHLSRLERSLASRGVDRVLVRTDRPLIGTLRDYLVRRASRVRG